MPNWVNALFKLRNILVRPFGLDDGESENRSEKLKKIINDGSGSAGLMSVTDATDDEIVILLSDKHLDAYMSVLIEKIESKQIVVATTLVRYHNRLGRIYFSLIRPFHMIIVKSMLINTLKRVIK